MAQKEYDEVDLVIYGYKCFPDDYYAEEFFQMLMEADPNFLPQKIGLAEPIKIPFSMEAAKKLWIESDKCSVIGGGIDFKSRKIYGSIGWKKSDDANIIGLHIHRKLVLVDNGVQKLIELAQKLFLWSNAVYGYVKHNTNSVYTPGLTHRTCIGGITWLTLFGPPYVKMFGKEIIQSAPCVVEEFAENHFMLLTSEEPIKLTRELAAVQEKVKNHLGEDAFCRREAPKVLTMEDLIAGRHRPSKEGYRSPDLSAYIKDYGKTRENQDKGMVVLINDDGSMTTYKVKPEQE